MLKHDSNGLIAFPEALNELIKAEGSIKLSEFSKVFFPMFVAYFTGVKVDLNAWFYATGTRGTLPVNVLDGKEVVFTVPPIISTKREEFGVGLQRDPADIMAIAQIKDREAPGAGNRYIEANLTNAIDYNEYDEKEQLEFEQQWVKIFEYYGYTSDNTPSTKKGKIQEADLKPFGDDEYVEI